MADEASITTGGDTGLAAGGGGATAVRPALNPATSAVEHRHARRGGGVWRAALTVTQRLRDLLATAVLTVGVLTALVLALGAVLTALGANERNEIVAGILSLGAQLVGPFADVFAFDDEVRQVLVNWGIAAGVYLVAGRVLERLIRP
jgi:hypothetical protein